jgi:isopentenyl diphosphate isomerase/L-lactate dehydrogenase-like FMN-dependent dehydrogenase
LHVGNWQLDAAHAPTPTWETVKELVSLTKMPVIIKGVLTKEAAQQAVAAGARGVIVSNHGGRQLDQTGGTIEALPEVVEGAAGRIPVLIDGGIRRGPNCADAGPQPDYVGKDLDVIADRLIERYPAAANVS